MKQRIKKTLFPNICISFTLVSLFLSVCHIIGRILEHLQHKNGVTINGYCLISCEIFVMLCLVTAACVILEKLNLKNKKLYPILELIINYIGFLGGAYIFRWMTFHFINIISMIVIITILYLNIYIRIQRQCKKESDEINRLLKQRGV